MAKKRRDREIKTETVIEKNRRQGQMQNVS